MSKRPTPELRRALAEKNRARPPYMVRVPTAEWPDNLARRAFGNPEGLLIEVWWSRSWLAQIWQSKEGAQLVSINRTSLGDDGRWRDGVTWDELMEVKRQIGRAHRWAVEVYPPDTEVKNVANIRHLWLLPEAPAFAWRPSEGKS